MPKACHAVDRTALLGFKAKITRDLFQLLRTWKPSTDCCTA
uniref:Leucine-rich repeat-containing N-terminal plant-type domain-containing protein n=1 Tax=Nelumbo nucifera TaxID=4432 RepID=A0A822ZBK1_NELNU|nr:TPA_asm: hypothetical protein HUJ06_012012 [Nelumbo nucifera]DAD41031.1 TPA_asm: hypothetical protein HUJ06_015354 [Nelumbo nucifera]